jgi:hypothetical protein
MQYHLEQQPLIVPPVLSKGSPFREPILRLVWGHAYRALRAAGKVVFVGYSLPQTDLATVFLLRQSLVDIPDDGVSITKVPRLSARRAPGNLPRPPH